MKKITGRKLALQTQTIRELTTELAHVRGGSATLDSLETCVAATETTTCAETAAIPSHSRLCSVDCPAR